MKKHNAKQTILIITLLIALFAVSFVWARNQKNSSPQDTPSVITLNAIAEKIFKELYTWLPDAAWQNQTTSIQSTVYGDIPGITRSAEITSKTASTPHFENETILQELGFMADNNLSADGPGSSTWGYKKTIGNDVQIILFSARTIPTSTSPNEPLQFDCPCTTHVSVFVSDVFHQKTQ